MAITLDTIVNKVFKVVKNGYDNNEVEAFLDEILEEMENREVETNRLKEQVVSLTNELEQTKAELQRAKVAADSIPVDSSASSSTSSKNDERHGAESFELVLTKAKNAYDEIVAAADVKADEIVKKANEDALNVRARGEMQMTELNKKLNELRSQASDYCEALKKAMETHAATMEEINRLL